MSGLNPAGLGVNRRFESTESELVRTEYTGTDRVDERLQRVDTRSLYRSPGIYMDSFEDLSNWTAGLGNLTAETSTVYTGSQAAAIEALSGDAKARIRKSVSSLDFTDWDPSIAFHPNGYNDSIDAVQVLLLAPDFSNYVEYARYDYRGDQHPNEWHRLNLGLQSITDGGSLDLTSVGSIRLQFETDGSEDVTVLLDDLRKRPQLDRGIVVFSFDDGVQSHYDTALPKLREYGWGGTSAVTPNNVGDSGYMSKSEIEEWQSSGGDVVGHGSTDLTTLSESELQSELRGTRKWLQREGCEQGSDIYITPKNATNSTVLDELTNHFQMGAQVTAQGTRPFVSSGAVYPWHIQRNRATDLSNSKSIVDRAANRSQMAVFCFHDFGDSLTMSAADFESLVDYVAGKGDAVDVLTLSDVQERLPIYHNLS